MAVTVTNSTQYAITAGSTGVPMAMNAYRDDRSVIRYAQFDCVQGSAAGDSGSKFYLGVVPAFAKILPTYSYIYTSAYGGSRVVAVGYLPYDTYSGGQVVTYPSGSTPVANALKAFIDAGDVSSAGYVTFGTGTAASKVPFSFTLNDGLINSTGIILVATVTGGTIPALATMTACVAFVAND
jgi:hypothetical protein